MQNKKKDTKTEILDIAEDCILTRGYNAFSYNDISEKIGIRKASIHYHFPTKGDLGSAVIRRLHLQFLSWSEIQKNISSKEKLEQLKLLYGTLSGNCNRICPLTMLTAEYPTLPEAMRTDINNLLNVEKDWLKKVLEEGISQKEFKANVNPEILSEILLSSISFALSKIRIHKNPDLLDKMFSEFKKMII